VVRFTCRRRDRAGRYRLAGLIERYGPAAVACSCSNSAGKLAMHGSVNRVIAGGLRISASAPGDGDPAVWVSMAKRTDK